LQHHRPHRLGRWSRRPGRTALRPSSRDGNENVPTLAGVAPTHEAGARRLPASDRRLNCARCWQYRPTTQ
jgi:hypothetical protein